MVSERRVRKAIYACVSRMVFSLDGDETPQAESVMTARDRVVAQPCSRRGLRTVPVDERMIRPAKPRRLARFRGEAGRQLRRAFVEAFEGMARTGSVFGPSRT